MAKKKLFSVLVSKINRVLKERNALNVVDLRLYINDVCTGDIFSIKEKEEIYNSVKDIKKDWFIDFYENIDGENRVEFMDIVIYKKDIIEDSPNEVFVVEMTYFDETNITWCQGYYNIKISSKLIND